MRYRCISNKMAPASREKVREVASRLGKSPRTIRYWIAEGCDIDNKESLREFAEAKQRRKTNIERSRERLSAISGCYGNGSLTSSRPARPGLDRLLGDLPPPCRRGAAAALERLEETEERAHARLLKAMERGNPVVVREQQEFWLKCSETLRRLDLAVELARRNAEEQVPKRVAQETTLVVAEWLRIAFAQFLSAESSTLMGIKQHGEFKKYAVERFKGIIDLTVKSSLQTRSPIPDWAAEKVREAWNVR
jgi:DNA-binding transcriptional MerR regulator